MRIFSHPRFLIQATAAAAACAALTLWPPPSGKLLLIPIDGESVGAVAGVALAGDARLLGSGPLPDSLIVIGERAKIAHETEFWKMIIMAAPPKGCGLIGALS